MQLIVSFVFAFIEWDITNNNNHSLVLFYHFILYSYYNLMLVVEKLVLRAEILCIVF